MTDIVNENRLDVLKTKAGLLAQENQRLVKEVGTLKTRIAELEGQSEAALQTELFALQERVNQLNQALFGDSSERRSLPKEAKSKKPKRGHGPTPQPALPIVETTHELDAADQACPECGDALKHWEGQDEVTEEIDVVPAKFVRRRHHKKKYKCLCGHIETALGPAKVIKSGRYSIPFGVRVAVDKYLDHLPLERQCRIMARAGLEVTSQTLWDQVWAIAQHLEPLGERLREHLLTKSLLGMDETRWRHLGPKPQKSWYIWAMCAGDAVYYHAASGRGTEVAVEMLEGYAGRLMTDDYSVYQVLAKRDDLTVDPLNCWAHVRRKFVEAEQYEPKRAANFVGLIGELYRIERELSRAPPEEVLWLRRERGRPVVDAIFYWNDHINDVLPKSAFGKALSYAKNLKDNLSKYLDDPEAPIDNNATERALRGVVLGRKNHLGSKSRRGAKTTTLLYSLLESAKLCGIDPEQYLLHAVTEAVNGRQPLLPHEYRDADIAEEE